MLTKLAISGYRTLRDLILPLEPLNLITGPNGSGKSNIYRALRLLADVAQGRIIQSLAAEGGLQSTLWAGPERFSRSVKSGEHPVQGTVRKNSVSVKLGFSGPDYGYAIDLGLPLPDATTRFGHDPAIKLETIWTGDTLGRANLFIERKGPAVRIRTGDGSWGSVEQTLSAFDSMMTHCADPQNAPEILDLRENMREWRFYDHFRTDREAPSRRPQIGTHTPVLSHDGTDLAAALQTIIEIGDADALDEAVSDAFPGAHLSIAEQDGYFEVEMHQHGLLRPLKAAELSDGTLRYLLWIAALLSPRPPGFLVLNEPETSLHADLLPALARLISQAADKSQIIVVSHAERLIRALDDETPCHRIDLKKQLGETCIDDDLKPTWKWPKR